MQAQRSLIYYKCTKGHTTAPELKGEAVNYNDRLHQLLTAGEGNVTVENINGVLEAARLSHLIPNVQAFIEDAAELLKGVAPEDSFEVGRAVERWDGVDHPYTLDRDQFTASAGLSAVARLREEETGQERATPEELYATAHDDLTSAVRAMVLPLAEGLEEEMLVGL